MIGLIALALVATAYEGLCDASAVVQLDSHIVVASDERDASGRNILGVYRLGRPKGTIVPLGKGEEADLEAVARLGDRLFWIGSHGAGKDGEPRPARRVLFALAIAADAARGNARDAARGNARDAARGNATDAATPRLARSGTVYRDLLADLARDRRYDRFGLAAAARRAPEDGGLSIEGLAARGETLLIGFRSPLSGGRALVATLLNADGVTRGERGRFGPPQLLDLGGRGIRALDTRADASLIVVAGPPGARGKFALYQGSVQRPLDFGSLRPEGVGVTPEGGLMLVSDDGDSKVRGEDCKKLPDADRRFRLFYLPPGG